MNVFSRRNTRLLSMRMSCFLCGEGVDSTVQGDISVGDIGAADVDILLNASFVVVEVTFFIAVAVSALPVAVSPPHTPPLVGKDKSLGCNGRTLIDRIDRHNVSITSFVLTFSAFAKISSRCTYMSTETKWAVFFYDVGGGTADDSLDDDKYDDVVPMMVGTTRVSIVLNVDECPLTKRAKLASSKTSKP